MRNKKYTLQALFFLIFPLSLIPSIMFGEGTKEILLTESGHGKIQIYPGFSNFAYYNNTGTSATAEYRLYIHIATVGEKIYYGFGDPLNHADAVREDVKYRIKDPAGNIVIGGTAGDPIPLTGAGHINTLLEAQAGPAAVTAGGYNQLTYTPTMTGDYFIEFNYTPGFQPNDRRKFKYFDVTVVSPSNVPKPGRLWSKAWQMTADANGNPFYGKFFIYSEDGIITSVNSNGMAPFVFTIACNQYGCYNTGNFINDRRSVSGDHIIPQYKIFLNDPDSLEYPTGILGEVIPPILVIPNCDGTATIKLLVTKAGNVDILLNLNPAPGVQPTDVQLNAVVVAGDTNVINWNGLNGQGQPVVNNTTFDVIVTYINGLTNLPISDIDENPNGFIIDLKRPTGNVPPVFWDDHLVGGGMNTSVGCTYVLPTTGCHTVSLAVGNSNTINTWWYAVTSQPYTVNYIHERKAQPLVFAQSAIPACANSNNNVYKVFNEPNTTIYNWRYTGTGATINQINPWDTTITINFAADATNGYLEVYGTNNNCNNPGDTTRLFVTLIPVPNLTTSLTQNACSGLPFSIPLTANPPATVYAWNVGDLDCSPNIQTCPVGNGANPSALIGNLSVTNLNPGTVTYHITPVANGCNGTTKDLQITVAPKPNVTSPSIPLDSVCDGHPFYLPLESGLSGSALTWQWSIPSSGCVNIADCPAPGTTPFIQDTLHLANSLASGNVTYSIVPTYGGCQGDPVAFTLNVRPLPPVSLEPFLPTCLNTPPMILTGGSPPGGIYTMGGSPLTVFDPVLAGVGSHSITYTVTNEFGCTDSSISSILVQDLISPNIWGNDAACLGVAETFRTDPGMTPTSYDWSVSPDGTIINGTNPWEISVIWTSISTPLKTISVRYTDPNGCETTTSSWQITVNPLPAIFVSGNLTPCVQKTYTYTTTPGQSNYVWSVSPGNSISFSNHLATVTWNVTGTDQWVDVNYTDVNNCTLPSPFRKIIDVRPTPVFSVAGATSVCAGSGGVLYSLEGTQTGDWTLSAGGSIVPPASATNAIMVQWNSSNSFAQGTLTVNYVNSLGCPGTTTKTVDIQPLPVTSFTSSSPSTVCEDYPIPYQYTVTPGGPAASYTWQITPPEMATIANPTANPASVSWKIPSGYGPQTATIKVTAVTTTTSPACSASSAPMTITINPKPSTRIVSCFDLKTTTGARPFTLRGGLPSGSSGSYYINSLTGSPATVFNPAVAGPGTHTIYYSYTDHNGCVAAANRQIQVFQASGFTCNTLLTDIRDGNTYQTTLIGTQCWMKENLRYGSIINDLQKPQTDNCIAEKHCLSTDADCQSKGGFYQWDEVMAYGYNQNQGLCPPGWHIPSHDEWQLMQSVITNGIPSPPDGIAGGFLKDTVRSPAYSARMNGMLIRGNYWAYADGKPRGTMFWTSTPFDDEKRFVRGVNTVNPSVSLYYSNRGNALSVRCIKD